MGNKSSAAQANEQRLGEVEVNVQRILKPVTAPSEFRKRLRGGLIVAAQHQQSRGSVIEQPPSAEMAWLWFIGAMILGAGLGFIVMRLRAR
ncbi:MAG: hypothetical protein HZB51_13475 [Chloroflexi bacterium]|nr:hypothetical protein [Chloroflexota bacterium]